MILRAAGSKSPGPSCGFHTQQPLHSCGENVTRIYISSMHSDDMRQRGAEGHYKETRGDNGEVFSTSKCELLRCDLRKVKEEHS